MRYVNYLIKRALAPEQRLDAALQRVFSREIEPEVTRKQLEDIRDYRGTAKASPLWRGLLGGLFGGGAGAGLGAAVGHGLAGRAGIGALVGGGAGALMGGYGGATAPGRAHETLKAYSKGEPMFTLHEGQGGPGTFRFEDNLYGVAAPVQHEAKEELKNILRELKRAV